MLAKWFLPLPLVGETTDDPTGFWVTTAFYGFYVLRIGQRSPLPGLPKDPTTPFWGFIFV